MIFKFFCHPHKPVSLFLKYKRKGVNEKKKISQNNDGGGGFRQRRGNWWNGNFVEDNKKIIWCLLSFSAFVFYVDMTISY